MTVRTITKTMTFFEPFKLTGMETEQPAGRYLLEVDDELLEGLSFPAYRRTATYLTLPRRANRVLASEMIRVDPVELAAVLNAQRKEPASKATSAEQPLVGSEARVSSRQS